MKSIFATSFILFLLLSSIIFPPSKLYCASNQDHLTNPDSLAREYNNLGVDYAMNGNYEEATKYFLKSLSIRESIPAYPKTKLANGYINIANLKIELGYLDSAMFYYWKAEKTLQGLNDISSVTLGVLYLQMGSCLASLQNYSSAIFYSRKGISVLETDPKSNSDRLVQAYHKLSIILSSLNRVDEAIDQLNIALRVEKGVSPSSHSRVLHSLGNLHTRKGDYSKAIEYFNRAEPIYLSNSTLFKNETLTLYSSIGMAYFRAGNFEKSHYFFKKGYDKLVENPSFSVNGISLLRNYASLYLTQNSTEKAKELLLFAINLNSHLSSTQWAKFFAPSMAVKCYVDLGDAFRADYFQNGNKRDAIKAIDYYSKSIELSTSIKVTLSSDDDKLLIGENHHNAYLKAIHLLALMAKDDDGYVDSIVRISARAKAAVLNESLSRGQGIAYLGIPPELLNRERNLRSSLSKLNELYHIEQSKPKPNKTSLQALEERIFQCQHELNSIADDYKSKYSRYHNLIFDTSSVTISKIQRKLTRRQVAIDYVLADTVLISVAIGKTDYSWSIQRIDSGFNSNFKAFLHEISPPSFDNLSRTNLLLFSKASEALYRVLIGPHAHFLANKDLIIIPHLQLASIPFCALSNDNPASPRGYYELNYLVRSNAISYQPSLKTFLSSSRQFPLVSARLVSFAPEYSNALPDFDLITMAYRQHFADLPGAEQESNAITEVFNGEQYTGKNISKQQFQSALTQFDIVHLAMHTHIDEQNPIFSKLVLSTAFDSIGNGLLNVYELYEMNLSSRLAILSACRSGDGNLVRGEGLLSIARGLHYAGCPSLVAAQWRVDDFSGAEIVIAFAKNIRKGKALNESLQNAQITFIANSDPLRSHPYFWASYQLIGSSEMLIFPSVIKCFVLGATVVLGLLLALFFLKRKFKATR